MEDFFTEYIKEIRKYFNIYEDRKINEKNEFGSSGKSVYYNLFKEPVNRIFYCSEPEYSGTILVIFKYKGIYIVSVGSFGSCHICDSWEGIDSLDELQIDLERVFSRLQYYTSIDQIKLDYIYSPYIKKKFEDFKIIESL